MQSWILSSDLQKRSLRLEEEDYIFISPLRKIHKIKITKKVKPAYSDEEIEKLRDGCKYPAAFFYCTTFHVAQ